MKEYSTIARIEGPLIFVQKTHPVGFGELVRIEVDGIMKTGQVLDTSDDVVIVSVFETTRGMHLDAKIRFLGQGVLFDASPDIIGRVFDGRGRPKDDGPAIIPAVRLPVNGKPINPYARERPGDVIKTGVSGIDLATTIIRGQKLPIFSGAGLPHDDLAMQIARQSTISGDASRFAVVFAAIGITESEARAFMDDFASSGALSRSVVFLNTAADASVERLLVPRMALTAAEYLAFERGMHVLVILDDMTNYCEALREISAARQEFPGRRGYPGYMYTDLAAIYERAGIIAGKEGSITQLPIVTLPGDDITHPIPDLTGYITEGQIVLSRELHNKGIYPPIDVLQSLSRLMSGSIGASKTRYDHKPVADQVFACYADGKEARGLVSIVGEDALGDDDRRSLAFAENFERRLLAQTAQEDRGFDETLDIAWDLLSAYPRDSLRRMSDEIKDSHYGKQENQQDNHTDEREPPGEDDKPETTDQPESRTATRDTVEERP